MNEYNFKDVSQDFNLDSIRTYVYQMLEGLDYCHSHGIIHRDVKPSNMVIDENTQILKLIDFGLSEFFVPGKELALKVASRPYKGPELLVGYKGYGYALDLWAVGCILGGLVIRLNYLRCLALTISLLAEATKNNLRES